MKVTAPGRSGILLLIVAATALSAYSTPRPGHAHPNHGPSWGERYLKLELASNSVRLVYGLTFSNRYGKNIRAQADGDRDGVIQRTEAEAFGLRLAESLTEDVHLSINGNKVRITWGTPFVFGLEGHETRGPLAVEFTSKAPLGGGRQRLEFEDRAEFEGIYRTTASIVTAADVQLLLSGEGANPRRVQRRVVYLDLPEEGAPPPRRLTTEVLSSATDEDTSSVITNLVSGLGLVALLFVVLALIIRRRRRATGHGRDSEPKANSGGNEGTSRLEPPGLHRSRRGCRQTAHLPRHL